MLEIKMANKIDVRPIIVMLAEKFPATFFVLEEIRRPLKVGIFDDLVQRLDGEVSPRELKAGLGYYIRNWGYYRSCFEGTARLDLDGQPAGTVSAKDAAYAKGQLIALSAKHAARKAAKAAMPTGINTETTAPAPAPEEPRRLSLADLRAAALARKQKESADA